MRNVLGICIHSKNSIQGKLDFSKLKVDMIIFLLTIQHVTSESMLGGEDNIIINHPY